MGWVSRPHRTENVNDISPHGTMRYVTETPAPPDWQPGRMLGRWAIERPAFHFFADSDTTVTFAEAHEFVRRITQRLWDCGVKPGDTVALEMSAGLHIIFACAALHLAAASLTFEAAALVGESPQVDWLFTSERTVSEAAKKTIRVDDRFLADLPASEDSFEPIRFPSPDSLCRIALSSGSTGIPKQVPLSLEMVWHRSQAAFELFEPGRPFMSLLGLSTASGFHTFIAGLLVGECYVNTGSSAHNLSMIRSRGISAIKASPAQLTSLMTEARNQKVSMSSLATIYSAGGVIPVTLRREIREQTSARLINLYGSTEAGRAAERVILDDDVTYAGDAVEGTELTIVDDADMPVPPGTAGNVRYRRAHMATEYRNAPEATAAAFRDGWFYTGDRGSLNEQGRLTLLGRTSAVVNIGGVKVDPAQIETFVGAIGGIRECAGFVHAPPGEVGEFVLAVSCADDVDLFTLAHQLREAFGTSAPLRLFRLPALPRTANGKVALAELAEVYVDSLRRAADG